MLQVLAVPFIAAVPKSCAACCPRPLVVLLIVLPGGTWFTWWERPLEIQQWGTWPPGWRQVLQGGRSWL